MGMASLSAYESPVYLLSVDDKVISVMRELFHTIGHLAYIMKKLNHECAMSQSCTSLGFQFPAKSAFT